MTSNWHSELNNYLADFDDLTMRALNTIIMSLPQSGLKFDQQIRKYIETNVTSRLNSALEFFNIQSEPQVRDDGTTTKDDRNREADVGIVQVDLDDVVEIDEIKTEVISSDDETLDKVETVTSSHSGLGAAEVEADDDATQPMVFEQNVYRLSLDSCFSDDLSTCSPRPSNLPMKEMTLSPIDTPSTSPFSSPGFGAEDIKEEPNSEVYEAIILNEMEMEADECVVKMEDVPRDSEMPSTSQCENNRFVPPTESPPQDNSQPLKRACSDNVTDEAAKRQKTTEDTDVTGPNSMSADQNHVYICFYCRNQKSLFIESFADVYNHWECNHGALPFRFMAFAKAACFYCSEKYDIFPNLKNHHMHRHPTEIFIVVDKENRSKCGLCRKLMSAPAEMVQHFRSHHDPTNYAEISSPICFSQSEIEQLLRINSPRQIEMSQQIEAFICGHCQDKKDVNEISFIDHIEKDTFKSPCSVCKFSGNSIQETVQHEVSVHKLPRDILKHSKFLMRQLDRRYFRTKILFTNGLILYKHNLLHSTFDDRNEFWPFRERFAKQKSVECTKTTTPSKSTPQEMLHEKELQKYRPLRSNLRIVGISHAGDEDFPRIFLCICAAIGFSNVSMKDVFQIYRRKIAVIVQMVDEDLKNEIIRAWRRTPKLVKLKHLETVMDGPINIFIETELTPFFIKIKQHVDAAKDMNQIHSYFMTDDGIRVIGNDNAKQAIIWSRDDLAKFIQSQL